MDGDVLRVGDFLVQHALGHANEDLFLAGRELFPFFSGCLEPAFQVGVHPAVDDGDEDPVFHEDVPGQILLQGEDAGQGPEDILLPAHGRHVFHDEVFQVLQLLFHVGVVLLIVVRGGVSVVERGLRLWEDDVFLVFQVLEKLLLVLVEELPDDVPVPLVAGFGQGYQGGGDILHRHLHIIGVRAPEVLQDILQVRLPDAFLRGKAAIAGIDAADQQERFRVRPVPAAHFFHRLVAEPEGDAHAGEHPRQAGADGDQFRHFHRRSREKPFGGTDHAGKLRSGKRGLRRWGWRRKLRSGKRGLRRWGWRRSDR